VILEAISAAWNEPVVWRWSFGRRWNATATTMTDDSTATGHCSVLVDEFNFWSKFTEEKRVPELGKHT